MSNKVEILVPLKQINKPGRLRAFAGASNAIANKPMSDLLFMRSLLVSTGSNGNDDVFLKEEMWNARATPILKPVDWEHNTGRELTTDEQTLDPSRVVVDNQTIGVMYNTYAIDEDGSIIDEDKAHANSFDIPENFHIVDEAVIWKGLYPNTAARIEREATEGKLFVSMEAWFTDYDYVVGNKVVARNEETAFLENSLRANGGTGVYGNSRVKRALKNITFGGKGIVARPANEPSVIMEVSHEPISTQASSNQAIAKNIIGDVIRTKASEPKGENKMSEEKTIPLNLYTEATEKAASLEVSVKAKNEQLAEANKKAEALQKQLRSIEDAFTKGAELLEEKVPGFARKASKASPDSFFSLVLDEMSKSEKVAAEIREELEKTKGDLVSAQESARTAAREAKVDSLLGLAATDMSEDEKKKRKEKKDKMMAAVSGLGDEQFEALLSVWAEERSEAQKPPFGDPKKKGEKKEDEKKGADASELAKQILAAISDAKGDSSEDEISKAVSKALGGDSTPSDEDNLMAILDSAKASESQPPAGASEPQGFDLSVAMAGLVADILDREDKE